MNFFEGVDTTSGSFEAGGGALTVIPKDTNVLSVCEEASNKSYNGENYINLKWRVHKPEEYANRVIFQKIKVYESDPAKALKAKQMLAAIATNAGGKLFQAMQQANESYPSDQSLTRLTNVPMVLKMGVYKLDDGREGNWVQAVSPYAQQPAPVQQQEDNDIPW